MVIIIHCHYKLISNGRYILLFIAVRLRESRLGAAGDPEFWRACLGKNQVMIISLTQSNQ